METCLFVNIVHFWAGRSQEPNVTLTSFLTECAGKGGECNDILFDQYSSVLVSMVTKTMTNHQDSLVLNLYFILV